MIDIYYKDGTKIAFSDTIADLPITEPCEHVEEMMKSDYVQLSWDDNIGEELPVGAYIIPFSDNIRYSLLKPYKAEQKSADTWHYEPKFQHPKMYLSKVPLIRPSQDSSQNDIDLLDWSYTGFVVTLLQYIVDQANTALGLTGNDRISITLVGMENKMVSIQFSCTDILSALSDICNKLECEYHIDWTNSYKVLYFGHISLTFGEPTTRELIVDGNVNTPSSRDSKEDYWNAYEPQGSTRNISRRAASGEFVKAGVRLNLKNMPSGDYPDGIIYTDGKGRQIFKKYEDGHFVGWVDSDGNTVDFDEPLFLKPLFFENVYPKLDLYVYDVRFREGYMLEDGKKVVSSYDTNGNPIYKRYAVWYLRLAYPTYDANKNVVSWTDYNLKNKISVFANVTNKTYFDSGEHKDSAYFHINLGLNENCFTERYGTSTIGGHGLYWVTVKAGDLSIMCLAYYNGIYCFDIGGAYNHAYRASTAQIQAFYNAISSGTRVEFLTGINIANYPSDYQESTSVIIDGTKPILAFQPNTYTKQSGDTIIYPESSPLAGRGSGDGGGHYGFEIIFHPETGLNNYQEANDDVNSRMASDEQSTGVVYANAEGGIGTQSAVKPNDYEIVFQDDDNFILPTLLSSMLIPKGVKNHGLEVDDLNYLTDKNDGRLGNLVNIYNIAMDAQFETAAQQELVNETLKYIANENSDTNSYTMQSNPIVFKTDNPRLRIGQKVIYKNGDYELDTRVMKLVTKLDFEYIQEITVGNEILKGAQQKLEEQVQTLIGGSASNGGGSVTDTDIIRVIQNWVTPRFLSKTDDDKASGNIEFNKDISVVGKSTMNDIQSSDFTGDGMFDTGFRLWFEQGRAKLVIDDLVARGKFTVNELESRIWTYAGGNMVFSGAGSTIFYVEYLNDQNQTLGYTYILEPWLIDGKAVLAGNIAWCKRKEIMRKLTDAEKLQVAKFRCYEYSDNGTMQTRNWWHINDLAFCESLNHVKDKTNSDGSYSGRAENTVYWRKVVGIGSKTIPAMNDGRIYDYVDLSATDHAIYETDDWPAAGDVIVQRGNTETASRQSMVSIEITGDVFHGFKIYDGISGYNMGNTEWISLGYDVQTGKADMKIYGDAYIGARDQSAYLRFTRGNGNTGTLDIKARINIESPIGDTGKTLGQTLNDIEGQIDKKAETWYQNTNPESNWYNPQTTPPLDKRSEHVGDLWYCTADISGTSYGKDTTWYYKDNGVGANPRYEWEQQNIPKSVFDEIDGKGAIYSGWEDWIVNGENKLQVRDLFIPTNDTTVSGVTYKAMKIYKCTTAGANPVFEEVAYTDDKAVQEFARVLLGKQTYESGDIAAAAAVEYAIQNALAGGTVVAGGIMLTQLIGMRKYNGGDKSDIRNYTTWGGISGQYIENTDPDPQDPSAPYAKGHGIAAWYGGDMIDYEMLEDYQQQDGWGGQTYNIRWAKSIDRFDGSGYRASGNITWDEDGAITLKSQTVKTTNFYLGGDDITGLLNDLKSMFRKVNVAAQDETPVYAIEAMMDFYSVGGISALGYNGSGGGGASGALYNLIDVKPDDATNPSKVYGAQTGYVLTYGSDGKWYANEPSQGVTTLADLNDTAITSVANGQTLIYNSTSGKWENGTISGGVQSDWNETDTTSLAYIQNKPTIPTASNTNTGYAANADYAVSAGGVAWNNVSNKPDIPTPSSVHAGYASAADSALYAEAPTFYINGTTSDLPRLVLHIPSVHYTRILMDDSGDIHIADEGSPTTYRGLTVGALTAKSTMKMATGLGLEDSSGAGMLCFHPTNYTGVSSSQWAVGAIDCQGVIRSNDTVLRHYRYNDGTYDIIESKGGQVIANNLQVASVKIEETNEINSYSGMLHLNYRVNTGVSLCIGGGNVGIGTVSPSYKLHVSGDIYATGGVTCLSDKRKKDIIGDIDLSVEQIANAPAIRFLWKQDHSLGMQVGTIAQYWQPILPEVVNDKNDELSMQYGVTALSCAIVNARKIMSHEERIARLEAAKKFLENENKKLRNELEHLKSA